MRCMMNKKNKDLTVLPTVCSVHNFGTVKLFIVIWNNFFLQEHFRATLGVQAIIEDDVMVIFFLRVKKKHD